jgi:signal transduction histidine kinase
MTFRHKLLITSALTVIISVGAVTGLVSEVVRRSVEQDETERTQAFWAQFRRDFDRQGQEVAAKAAAIASSDLFSSMTVKLNRSPSEAGGYFDTARSVADAQQLDFLEFVDGHGTIITSAQSPATYGYAEPALTGPVSEISTTWFLKQEQLAGGNAALGLFAARGVRVDANTFYVLAGRRMDQHFLASLDMPAGMRALLYENRGEQITSDLLIENGAKGPSNLIERFAALIRAVRQSRQETTAIVHWTSDAADDEAFHAFPLQGAGAHPDLLGVFLVGTSRRQYVNMERHIRTIALLVGGGTMLLATLFGSWMAARFTRPVEDLAHAARSVASGNWDAHVEARGNDELSELAGSFNQMTGEMQSQRERLLQAERVAAWRELARRLAHELKNPLFPLQLTVDNLVRAKTSAPDQFDEVFRESASALRTEIANLKEIVERFSDFSRMPQPRLESVAINELVQRAQQPMQAQMSAPGHPPIHLSLQLDSNVQPVLADPELLHRALSNLILNAMDAMPNGGALTLRTREAGDHVLIDVSDTGTGLTPEEIERIFTPYYTSKQHGTGLGLAIVQSVVSDHGGTISVKSNAGAGTTFTVSLPKSPATFAKATTVN